MKKLLAAVGLALLVVSAAAFAAVPSLSQIQQSISQGNWPQADAQLSQVVDAYPNNARARYLYGQVLDREGRSVDALEQIQRAKSLDPQIRFTDPAKFAQTEARVRADAQRLTSQGERRSATSGGALLPSQPQQQQLAPAAPAKHEPSSGMWIGFAVLIGVIALVLRWTLRRARSSDTQRGDDERRAQLKRATDLLNEVRPLKLDARLSTAPGAAALNGEIENVESQARTLVETLSNGKNPVPPYQLDELERQFASLKARVEGRPDPNAAPAAQAGGSGSAYAQEAERFGGGSQQPPYSPYPPQQQPPVVVQQGGGFGGDMGGLLTGVLLGQAMSGGRERVIERDVIVDDDARRRAADPGFDLGQGDSWGNGGAGGDSGGGVDLGSSDDWSNNS